MTDRRRCARPDGDCESTDRVRTRTGNRVLSSAVLAAAVALAGCSAVDYYWQGIAGQADLLARAKPIAEVIETTPDPALKARLARVQAIRAFASSELGLPGNRSYTDYADLGRPFVVWNVFAAPELSLAPRQWCFPVAGCVAYRGYFAESDARAEAARLAASGDDVHVSGVPAYSTLGYFADPVLSTFIRYREAELARLVFHELAHQVVYVKDDTSFNESFATAVEEEGVARWVAAEGRSRDPAEVAALAADVARGQRRRAEYRALMATTRERLAVLYGGTAGDDEKRAGKAAVFAQLRAEIARGNGASDAAAPFERWLAAGANNAGVAAASLYADRVPQFRSLLDAENRDLPRFYDRVKALAALPRAERDRALAQIAANP
jgi:predicted aminopeptidase